MDSTPTISDLLARLRAALPRHWFADDAPILDSLLTGLADGWAWLFGLLDYVRQQTRLATLTDFFLDIASYDYLGARVTRGAGESDTPFRSRIEREMLRDRGTRSALVAVLEDLTGRPPDIFEPARPADTGAWNGVIAYGVTGRWGSLSVPFQCFVTAYRPLSSAAGGIGGYGTGATPYGTPGDWAIPVADADIYAAIASVMPVAATAWTRIAS